MRFDANGWLDVAVEIDYLNKSMSRQGYAPTMIVIHGTAGGSSAQGIANYFATGTEQASAHFVIGQDGTIVQGVPCSLAAWGNGVVTAGHAGYISESVNPNFYTISIEHVKPATDNSSSLTAAQQQASFALVDCLCSTYGIQRSTYAKYTGTHPGVIRHADIDPVNRARCPGPYPFDELWNYLNTPTQGESMYSNISIGSVGGYFTEIDAATWECVKTKQKVGGAILKYYLTHFGPAIHGLPISAEYKPYANDSAANKNVIAFQCFERTVIVYDPDGVLDRPWTFQDDPEKRCYTAHIDRGIGQQLITQALVAPLQSQVKQLQQQLATETQKDLAQTAQLQQQITALQSQIQQLQTELTAASGDKYLTVIEQIKTLLAPLGA